MSELTPEEEALLAADPDEQSSVAEEAPTPEAQAEVEEPKKRGRKPRAAVTDVEPAEEAPESATDDLDLRVIPLQHHGDPWGDTPAQSRF